jgi:pimeloyl-ACP methyl ester carboxylesterase
MELFYEDLGDPADPPVLLIMGVGAQPPMWPDGFCEQLIKHGYRVIRFDHRDTGLSTKIARQPGERFCLSAPRRWPVQHPGEPIEPRPSARSWPWRLLQNVALAACEAVWPTELRIGGQSVGCQIDCESCQTVLRPDVPSQYSWRTNTGDRQFA